jgi:hypothetical protein
MEISPVHGRVIDVQKVQAPPLKMRRAATVTGAAISRFGLQPTPTFVDHQPLLESTLESKDMIRRISIETVLLVDVSL